MDKNIFREYDNIIMNEAMLTNLGIKRMIKSTKNNNRLPALVKLLKLKGEDQKGIDAWTKIAHKRHKKLTGVEMPNKQNRRRFDYNRYSPFQIMDAEDHLLNVNSENKTLIKKGSKDAISLAKKLMHHKNRHPDLKPHIDNYINGNHEDIPNDKKDSLGDTYLTRLHNINLNVRSQLDLYQQSQGQHELNKHIAKQSSSKVSDDFNKIFS